MVRTLVMTMIAVSALAGCVPDLESGCHVGVWKREWPGKGGCVSASYLRLGSDARLKWDAQVTVCDTAGGRTIVGDASFYQRDYATSGADFTCLEDSHYFVGRGTFACEGSTMVIADSCVPGTWTRLEGSEAAAVTEFIDLRCNAYWSSCEWQ